MICVITSSHYSDDERVYHKQIKTLINSGREVLYVTAHDMHENLLHPKMNHIKISLNNGIAFFIKSANDKLKNYNSINHLQIHEPELLPLIKLQKTINPDLNTIYDVHENIYAMMRTFSSRNVFIRELNILRKKITENFYLKYVDKIILANDPMGDNYYNNFRGEIYIFENFPEKIRLIKSYSARKNDSLIYHGHLAPERGISELIVALSLLLKKHPNIYLTIIGTFRIEKYKQKIYKLINDLKLQNNIEIINQIKHEEIWSFLINNSIGVIPFKSNPLTINNIPTKLFEFMSSGCSIVSSNLKPIKNYVDKTVYWAIPGDIKSLSKAIDTCIGNVENKFKIDKNLKLISKTYNWDNNKQEFLKVFSKL